MKRTHTKVRISYDKSAKTIEVRRNDNVCNLYKKIADLVEDNEERYNMVMAQGHEFKRQFIETQNYANMGPLMWPNMGPLMWPNMMADNFQNPLNLMPSMQSAIRGGPYSSLMGRQLQEWQGVQPSFLEIMNGMNNKKK